MNSGELLRNQDKYLSIEDRDQIQDICSEISVKVASLKSSKSTETNSGSNEESNQKNSYTEDFKIELAPLLAFAACHEIHLRFPDIIIHAEDYGVSILLF